MEKSKSKHRWKQPESTWSQIQGQVRISMSSGQDQSHREKRSVVRLRLEGNLVSIIYSVQTWNAETAYFTFVDNWLIACSLWICKRLFITDLPRKEFLGDEKTRIWKIPFDELPVKVERNRGRRRQRMQYFDVVCSRIILVAEDMTHEVKHFGSLRRSWNDIKMMMNNDILPTFFWSSSSLLDLSFPDTVVIPVARQFKRYSTKSQPISMQTLTTRSADGIV